MTLTALFWTTLALAGGPPAEEGSLPAGIKLPEREPDEVVQLAGLPTDPELPTPKSNRAPDGLPSLFHDATLPEQRYAMRQIFTSQMKNPNPFSRASWYSTHTSTYAIVRLRRRDGRVEYLERTCKVETEPVFGAETIYTQAFIDAVDLRHRVGIWLGDEVGSQVAVGPFPQQFGIYLKDPFNDPLPTDPEDSRIVDQDKDGLPGVTVVIRHPMVGQGKVWIAQRSVARLEGKLIEGGMVRGFIRTAPDMFKIGADRWWLRAESPQRPHPDPTQSPFILVPVKDDFGCKELIEVRNTLFPPPVGLD